MRGVWIFRRKVKKHVFQNVKLSLLFNLQCPVILLTQIMVLFQYTVIRHFIHLAAQLTSFDVQLLYLSIILLGVNIEQRKESQTMLYFKGP